MRTPSQFFPPAETADDDGLVGLGGELSTEWLLDAYRHGIFPWPIFDTGEPLAWWSLDPRAVIEFDRFHVARRLRRTLKCGRFNITLNHDFRGVIKGCASTPERRAATWITPEMIDAYTQLHDLGCAHSVETWKGGELVGGIYGVAIGGLFAAESMFYRARDASKVALVHLIDHLRLRGYVLFDVQQWTSHTARFGVIEIPRTDYLDRLEIAIDLPVTFGDALESLV